MSDQPYPLVVFDWDGTLIDSTAAIVYAIRAAAADLGLPVPAREVAAHVIGLGLHDAIRYAVPSIQPGQVPQYVQRYRYHYLKDDAALEAFDGIPDLLDTLAAAGARLAVATGKSRAGLDRALDQMGWRGRFLTTRCADEGLPKPDPWMLRDICEELEMTPSAAVMIGDTTHDLGMARSAGAAAVAVTYGAHPRDELVREPSLAIVDTVAELRAVLLRGIRAGA
ncbi:MAG: HAD-IA family hydrolase [Burkholderiaceae bacterium]